MSGLRRALLLVGSPKGLKGASANLGTYLLEQLAARGWITERLWVRNNPNGDELVAAVAAVDLVIMAAPLYVDSIPGPMLRGMELIARARSGNAGGAQTGLVAVVNAGYPETRHCAPVVTQYRLFAREAGFEWLGALAMGQGPMANGKSLAEAGDRVRTVRQALDLASAELAEGRPVPEAAAALMARPLVPPWLYRLVGNLDWFRSARKNKAGPLHHKPFRPPH